MDQGQGQAPSRATQERGGNRHHTARRGSLRARMAVATLGLIVVGLTAPTESATAGAASTQAKAVVVTTTSPTSTTTTTTTPRSITTATTTVTTTPRSVSTVTVTTVAPTTRPSGSTSTVVTTTTTTAPTTSTTPSTSTTSTPTTSTPTTSTPTSTTSTSSPTTTTVPAPPAKLTLDATCMTPVASVLQRYFDSLPAGSTFQSSTTACYLVPGGFRITKPLTIIGGTFYDPTTEKPSGPGYDGMKPIIFIKSTSDVTLSNLTVLGANTTGVFHSSMVGQAGVKVTSSARVTITDVTAKDTWGDGLELWSDFVPRQPRVMVTDLKVDGFTTIDAGRVGVTVATVSGGVLNNVHVISPGMSGFDFESDLPGVGSGNVAITNCTDDHGFSFVEYLTGPITVTNCTGFHHVTLGSINSNQPVTFQGGSMLCKRADPVPCIKQNGGTMRFVGTSITRMDGKIGVSTPMWSVDTGGSLTFAQTTRVLPFGVTANGATVSVQP